MRIDAKVRTRFAPSPTGNLHLGNVRTALFAWLYARHFDGKFFLRIEDSDFQRSDKDFVKNIFTTLQWLKLDWDEEVVYQSKRFNRYREIIQNLLDKRYAYRCFCSPQRLDELRLKQKERGEKPRYDGKCRNRAENDSLHLLNSGKNFVVRFCNSQEGEVEFDDMVRGKIRFLNSELDDLIILRSDNTPTYNLSVVVDDMDMAITHVIRGDSHINNTPRQINIFNALNYPPPIYAHIPTVYDEDRKPLSKRRGALSVLEYREHGFVPPALLNYIVRLGWSCKNQEIFSLQEMIELFDLTHLSRSPAVINYEKFLWLNQYYLKNLIKGDILDELKYHMTKEGIDITNGPDLKVLLEVQSLRFKTLKDITANSKLFYLDELEYSEDVLSYINSRSQIVKVADKIFHEMGEKNWQEEELQLIAQKIAHILNLSSGEVSQSLRFILVGNQKSPAIHKVLFMLGYKKVQIRIRKFL